MKICYLILAHNNFHHLDRLIEALDDENSVFCIHLDKKVQGSYSSSRSNVKIIGQHVDIRWGGFSMVKATISLLKYGVKRYSDSDYFILISGVDYPIRNKGVLYNLLSKGKEYIDIAPLPVPYKPVERYEYYYFDYDRRNLKYYNPKFILEVILKKFKIKRKAPFKIYVGSQWFALTNKCTEHILDTIKNDRRYIDFFKHTLVPDEAFFQTIIGNSSFSNYTVSNLTYTDWEVPIPPATIGEQHVEFLKTHIEFNDEYGKRYPYFARKFNDGSENILKLIRDILW
ncbi:MAG: beta-1,6-N-acetylglucosaminyltransferase [Dysgonomonas sp.]|nr:beta-1,6-N-acetylglucosaminyltransferase [Dysgonomonas sp.]